jgi:hypothetical protein
MKQGPEGIECESCGLALDPVSEEGAEIALAEPNNHWPRTGLIAGGVIFLAGFLALIIANAPSNGSGASALNDSAIVANVEDYVLDDEAQLVSDTLQRRSTTETVNLVNTIGCQAVAADTETNIRWVSMVGATLNTFRPAIPANWTLHSACPTESGGAYLLTHLNDGLAISEVTATGDLVWSQLLPADSDLPDASRMTVSESGIVVLLPLPDISAARVVSFDFDGTELWKETIYVSAAIERPHMAQNGLGDFVQAWTELDRMTRLVVLSPAGVLVQNTEIAGPSSDLRGVAGDDFGQTLLVFDEAGVSAQLVSAAGTVGQRWQIESNMTPIGVVRHEDNFLVFALSPTRLSVWGVNEYGATSSPTELNVSSQLIDGEINQINAFEAIASLRDDTGAITDITLDLRRISNGLVFDSANSASMALNVLSSDLGSDTSLESSASVAELPSVTTVEAVNNDDPESVVAPEVAEPDVPDENSLSDPQTVPNAPSPSDAEQIDVLPSANAPGLSETEARCTFSCQTVEAPVAEYVLSQIVEKTPEETLQDVRVRLNETHENLCALSGGEPVEGYLRVCEN